MQKDYSKVEMEPDTELDREPSKKTPNRNRVLTLPAITGTILAIIIILIGLMVLTRYRNLFPTTMRPFDLNDTNINHPEKPYTISGAANVTFSSIIVFLVTIIWFFLERRIAKKNILNMLLTVYFTMLGACFMIILVNSMKNMAGNLRPYFLSACKPNQTMVEELESQHTTWVDANMTETICTSERSLKYRWSFPSGHSAEAWYAMTLSILIIQYTKNITVKYTENLSLMLPFKAVFQFILFAFASWIGISRTLDYHHFWWDVLAGSLLGALIAVVMFYWFVKPVMEGAEETCCSSRGKKCGLAHCCAETTASEEVAMGTLGGEEELPTHSQGILRIEEPAPLQPDEHPEVVDVVPMV